MRHKAHLMQTPHLCLSHWGTHTPHTRTPPPLPDSSVLPRRGLRGCIPGQGSRCAGQARPLQSHGGAAAARRDCGGAGQPGLRAPSAAGVAGLAAGINLFPLIP